MILDSTMGREIDAQPRILADLLPKLRHALSKMSLQCERVLAGGCGDSYFAAYAHSALFAEYGVPYAPVTAQELTSYSKLAPTDLVILISVSGGTARTVEAAHVAAEAGASTLAITCNPESALSHACEHVLVLPYKPISRKTPHTLDYTVSLLALALTAERIVEQHLQVLNEIPELMRYVISDMAKEAREITKDVTARTKFFFLGAGPHRGTAMYGAAKFHEAGGLTALHDETENFVHGMNFMLEPGDIVTLIAPSDAALYRAQELVEGLNNLQTVSVSVSDAEMGARHALRVPSVPWPLAAFLTCLGPQILCHAASRQLGLELEQARAGRAYGMRHTDVQARWMNFTNAVRGTVRDE